MIDHTGETIKDYFLSRIQSSEPENCRWATWKEQANNRQSTVYFKIVHADGKETIEYGVGKYEQEHGLTHNTIYNRLYGVVQTNEYKGDRFYLLDEKEAVWDLRRFVKWIYQTEKA